MTTADSAIQQSTVGDTPKQAGRKEKDKPTPKSSGLQYYEDPKAIRKTIQPSLKEDVDILVDFGMPSIDELTLKDDKTLGAMLNDLQDDSKAPRYWLNTLLEKHPDYKSTLLFILNLKATLLSSANVNLLKEWRLSDKVKVPPQDVQEVGAIASLYETKRGNNEKIIDTNTKAIKDYVLTDDEHTEKRKEIILNIALGNLGGLYQELVKRDKGDSKKVEQAL